MQIPREEIIAIAISALIVFTLGFAAGYAARQITVNDKILITEIENKIAQTKFYEEQFKALEREFRK